MPTEGRGAGHASVAVADERVLMVFDQGVSLLGALRHGLVRRSLYRLLGVPDTSFVGEQVMLSFDAASGDPLWRASLGIGGNRMSGHLAGTPAVADHIAYVPSPLNGRIVAARLSTGAVLWSTDVDVARGSVVIVRDRVTAAARDSGIVVLTAREGRVECRGRIPSGSDRVSLTLAGGTGVLTLENGTVIAAPITDWIACRVP